MEKADYDLMVCCEEWERVQLDVHMGKRDTVEAMQTTDALKG